MSVQRNDFVIIGQKISQFFIGEKITDREERSKWVESLRTDYSFCKYNIEPKPFDGKITAVFDGMGGQYVIVGHVVNCSKADECDGLPVISLSLDEVISIVKRVETILEVCEIFKPLKMKLDIQLHTFSHFS